MLVDDIADAAQWFKARDAAEIHVLDIEFQLVVEFVRKILKPVAVIAWFVLHDLSPHEQAFVHLYFYAHIIIESAAFHRDFKQEGIFISRYGESVRLITNAGNEQ